MELDELYILSQTWIDSYKDRNTLFQQIDSMFNLEWSFPSGVPDWVLKSVSTSPRDSVVTTVRTFATVTPQFKVMPMLPDENNRKRANEIEAAIRYSFKQAGRRNDSQIEWDVMMSATLYAEIASQVIYLPYQEKVLESLMDDKSENRGNSEIRAKIRRAKAARRFGDYAYLIHNPANIYPSLSEYGLEGVLCVRSQSWDEFVASWGNLASKLDKPSNGNGGYLEYVSVFDYYDYENRYVWAVCDSSQSVRATPQYTGGGVKILDQENKLGFIPYAIKRWGNSLTSDTDKRVMPLLQSVYTSGQWDALNVTKSLDFSLSIKRAAQPGFAAEVPAGQSIEFDYTDPVGSILLPPGTRNFTTLPSQSFDQRVASQKNEIESDIWQTSIPKILQTMDFASGTAASQANMVMTQATNSLSPYKILAEKNIAEVVHQMLCWGKYFDKEYNGGKGTASLYGRYEDKTNMGKMVSIPFNTIDPDALQIEVTLKPDTAVDRLQQINGAVMLYNTFKVPQSELLEDLVGGDPEEMRKRRDLEDYKQAYIAADLQRITMAPQLEAQQQTMEMQMGMQQQAQSQQMEQEQAAREQEAQMARAQGGGTPSQDQMGGLMNNSAAGGVPPVALANGQGQA